jgi:hypothetical protein
MQQTLRAVYDGLQATQRATVWSLQGWPNQRVTNLDSFARRGNSFNIDAELLNSRNQVIGRQSFRSDGWWEYTYTYDNGYVPTGIRISDDVRRTVSFTVKADDITDTLTIRIARVNGTAAETAARNGVLQIRALPKAEYDLNNEYKFVVGEIRGYSGGSKTPVIPRAVWDETVVGIGYEAFNYKQLTRVTIPDSVTYIGDLAFANNQLTGLTIPDSVTYIGNRAFDNAFNSQAAISVIIGANVSIAANAFNHNFTSYYNYHGRQAGQYDLRSSRDGYRWRGKGISDIDIGSLLLQVGAAIIIVVLLVVFAPKEEEAEQ